MLQGYGQERDRLFRQGGGDYMNAAYPGARSGQNSANMGVFNSLGSLLGLAGGGGGGPYSGGSGANTGFDMPGAGGGIFGP
jgi:hypothetical protein